MLAQECGISPIVCITKSDLKPISDPILDWYEQKLGIPVLYTSAVSGEGIPELRKIILGKTIAFVGKSGVGKSSLTNQLLDHETTQVSRVSEKDGQ